MKQDGSLQKNSRIKEATRLIDFALNEIEKQDWPDWNYVRSKLVSLSKILKEEAKNETKCRN